MDLNIFSFSFLNEMLFLIYKMTLPQHKKMIKLLSHVVIVVHSLSCVRLCVPMDCSTPGFPVLHRLLELAQSHIH